MKEAISMGKQAFTQLKMCLTTAPILAMPDWTRPFINYMDASETGIRAVLSQCDTSGNEHVIVYASHFIHQARKELLCCSQRAGNYSNFSW